MRLMNRGLWVGTAVVASLAGCSAPDLFGSDPPGMVVGVRFDAPLAGAIDRVQTRVLVGIGEAAFEQSDDVDGRAPLAIEVPRLPEGTRARVSVDAYRGEELLLHRLAVLTVPSDRTVLLPMRLNDECRLDQSERDVSCGSLTCSAGFCISPELDAAELTSFQPYWDVPPTSACGPVDAGEPEVAIGLNEADDFHPMPSGNVLDRYRGLQGGRHVFYNLRLRGVHDGSAVTHHMLRVLDSGFDTVVTPLDLPVDVGTDGCYRFAHRYILPNGEFGAQRLWLGVTVTDATGNAAHHHVEVEFSELLNEE
jgi:hypothetical protein